jgi:RNA polymerase sigma factor (sigma-70 family)
MQRTLQDSHGPVEGLEQAYRRYRSELRCFFELNSRDPHAVDDLMQMMYLQLLNNRPDTPVREPQNYLFRMAWNVLHTANRRARTERERALTLDVQTLEALAERSNCLWLEDDTSSTLQQAEIERVLGELPRVCQVALLRQYRDNRTYKEIAQELGVTVHTVKKYTMRALNHFRMHFNSINPKR